MIQPKRSRESVENSLSRQKKQTYHRSLKCRHAKIKMENNKNRIMFGKRAEEHVKDGWHGGKYWFSRGLLGGIVIGVYINKRSQGNCQVQSKCPQKAKINQPWREEG